ncbi:hypothetical protein [Tenacibaculum dicentrarchi]|uniref:hypothetical protein n=1 Tax=Tenacibaculum dicentrarchi TaxID=669041 RepID=UPI000C7D40D8|nr:hypothetical protein TDCHD05_190009 [Tenacibaculum dicentrarchi]
MKINIKFWLALIIISTIIIVLKNLDFKQDKKHIFQRSFANNISIKKIRKQNIKKNTFIAVNDSLVCTYNFNDSINIFKIYNKYIEKIIDSFEFSNPKTRQISSFNRNNLLFIDKFNLYNYSTDKKNIKQYPLGKLKVISSFLLDKNASNILVLAELEKNNLFNTGFFIINTANNDIVSAHIIKKNNKSAKLKNSLIYSGKFSRHKNTISYVCNKTPEIFFFNNKGIYLKQITTKDATPKPKIVSNKTGMFYDRGNTFNTNNGIFKKGNNIYIFSSRTKDSKNIMIDIYSYDLSKYLSSIKFPYQNKTSTDINNISLVNNSLFLYFENEQLELKMHKK